MYMKKNRTSIRNQLQKKFGFKFEVITRGYGRPGRLIVDFGYDHKERRSDIEKFCESKKEEWGYNSLMTGYKINLMESYEG